MRLESLAVADRLAMYAAGASSWAERAPIRQGGNAEAGVTPVIAPQWRTDQATEGLISKSA